jgi:hypothetical protein
VFGVVIKFIYGGISMKELLKKVLVTVLVSIMFIVLSQNVDVKTAEATEIYITVEDYSKAIAYEINITAVNDSYAEGLKEVGIIREGEFSSYDDKITRGDAMVILSRADEYLNGTEITSELVQIAIDKRISDIGKVTEIKRVDVVKAYLKGFMKGYSNGDYCTDRELKVTKKITKEGALSCISMLKDNSKRAKISPDGQLIRTKNLPKTAKNYPYILESFPNEYYDWKLRYEGAVITGENGKEIEQIYLVDYASPADIDKLKSEGYPDFKEAKKEYLYEWVEKAKNHIEQIFSADYKDLDEVWIEEVMKNHFSYNTAYDVLPKKQLKKYVERAINNKTILECGKVAVDGSTLYCYRGNFYMRVYVKYRVVSSNIRMSATDELNVKENPYGTLVYSFLPVNLEGFTMNKWKEGYYDIELDEATGTIKDMGFSGTYLLPGVRR